MRDPDWAPLTGFRVAVTSARRAEELSTLLSRRGATVTSAAAIAMVPLPDDEDLHVHTEALIAAPPDVVVATTGIGFRGWTAAADGWGLAADLITSLSKARIVSRGPKATGALRAAGLPEEWSPESESSREVLQYLREGGIDGLRIAVQLHGATEDWDPFPEFLDELRAAGAEVVPIRVYRWRPSPRGGAFDALVTGIAESKFDAVSFTSAPAVAAMLMRAGEMGIEDEVLAALRSDVHAMCVGPVTARPLVRLGVPTSAPERMRLGALARHITDELPLLQSRTIGVAGHVLEIRGTCVMVDGVVKDLPPAGMATIRALAHRPGNVVSREELLSALPGGGTDTHAVETAVLRLRTALGDKKIVATVVKRGYRLAVDEPRQGDAVKPLLVAHGTRKPDGVTMVADLAERVGTFLGSEVRTAFVDVLGPTPADVLSTLHGEPVVVVPAFLASGHHVRFDIPAFVDASGHRDVTVTDALGPSPNIVRVITGRLLESGWQRNDSVILAAAGTSDPHAQRDLRITATLLSAAIGTRVELAYAGTGEPRVEPAVTAARARGAGRVVVASYLLADGLFQDRLRASGADLVTDPLGPHPGVARLIASRFRRARLPVAA